MKSNTTKRIIGFFLGIVVCVAVAMVPAHELMAPKAMWCIGLMLGAVIWILFNVVPDFVAAIVMSAMIVLLGVTPVETAFAQFSGTTVWIMIGALALGTAAAESGLLKRVALLLMRIMPANYAGQCLALLISGLIISPFVPSTAAKSSIVAPIAQSTSDALGIQPRTKPAVGVFMSFYTGYISSANGYLSGSFVSYSLVGLLAGYTVTWSNWFLWGIVFLVVATVLMALIILLVWRPKEKLCTTKESINEQIQALGKFSFHEKLVTIVLVACLVLWMLEKTLNIPSSMVACCGAMVTLGFGVFDRKAFRAKIPWDSILFIGCFIGISNCFSYLKINDAISAILGDKLDLLMSNPYLFVILMCLIIFALRIIIISNTTAVTIVTVILLPLCAQYGVHPFVVIFTGYAAANVWFMSYHNSPTIMSLAAIDSRMVKHSDLVMPCVYYMIICIIACLASVPWWQFLGLW